MGKVVNKLLWPDVNLVSIDYDMDCPGGVFSPCKEVVV